jgi:hypothetical protein
VPNIPSNARQLAGAIDDSCRNARERIAHASLPSSSSAVATVTPYRLCGALRVPLSGARNPAVMSRCSGGFKVNIDGDRIAGRKRFFQCLVKQVIHMCYRGWRFLRVFRDEHDVGALFAFVSLVYWVLHYRPKGRPLHVKRGTKTNVIVTL